ncbi:unnamed protein product [Anisakis simplex]|uniref:Uncharacterized protein n=1 Tax=Anisakis simplex TaxID=6269 RepID=A0A3P6PKV5_ANISI|nr:unnamed protein product [Anisakis simplex]
MAMLITKYQNRSGFCHRDLFRLCHIRPLMSFPKEHAYWQHHKEYDFILAYVVGGML